MPVLLGKGGAGISRTLDDCAKAIGVADTMPYMLYTSNNSVYNRTEATFWTGLDRQGDYITTTNVTSYTTVTNVTSGSGLLAWVMIGTPTGSAMVDQYIRITIDGTAKEFRTKTYAGNGHHVIWMSHPNMIRWYHNNNVRNQGLASFNATYTTAYENSFRNGYFFLPPASMLDNNIGLKFESSLKVEVKCANTLFSGATGYSGACYALNY